MMEGHTTAPKSTRDFVTENAISAILASPRTKQKPEDRNWLASKNFAKRPAYLDRIAAQLASEREYVLELADAQQRDAARQGSGGAVREMAPEERADLIAQLKAKWSEVSAVSGPTGRKAGRAQASLSLPPPLSPAPLAHLGHTHTRTSLPYTTPPSGTCSATACLRTARSPPPTPQWARSA